MMLTSDDIIKECVKGNRLAMQILYEQHCNKVLGICRRYAPDKADARDYAHDCWMMIFEKLHQFRNDGTVEAYISIITRNHVLRILKEKKKLDFEHLNENEFANEDITTTELEEMMDLFSMNEILESLEMLPIQYKTIFNLYAIDELTHKEISEKINISESNSKSILSRARQKLIYILRESAAKKNSQKIQTSTIHK